MKLPQISMRRTYLIARRDFLGYVKTIGFWVSLLLPLIFGFGAGLLSTMDLDFDPVRYETILDETGLHGDNIIAEDERGVAAQNRLIFETSLSVMPLAEEDKARLMDVFDVDGAPAASAELNRLIPGSADQIKLPMPKRVFVPAPVDNIDALKAYLAGDKQIEYQGQFVPLSGALHIFPARGDDGTVIEKAEYWSVNINNQDVKNLALRYFKNQAQASYLASGGLSFAGLENARAGVADIEFFSPEKSLEDGKSQEVDWTDRIPFFVSVALTFILWMSVFSGSYLLLTSMLEEKLNKLLETMLASARFSEIIFGKLLGVGAMTLAAMLPYIVIGFGGLVFVMMTGDARIMEGLASAFTPKLIIFFSLFLVLGYVFYGALFIAVGSLAESMQDAQTITTPIMIILTACLFLVMQGITSPDSSLIKLAAWFPLSAPFASILRLYQDPPWWELALSAFFLFILTIGVVWLAGRVFRYGAFSGGGIKSLKSWFSRHILRRAPKA